ncbi:MAG: hypothetical protein WBV23_03345, partial [Desulfobaccales bacterium]
MPILHFIVVPKQSLGPKKRSQAGAWERDLERLPKVFAVMPHAQKTKSPLTPLCQRGGELQGIAVKVPL